MKAIYKILYYVFNLKSVLIIKETLCRKGYFKCQRFTSALVISLNGNVYRITDPRIKHEVVEMMSARYIYLNVTELCAD